MTVLDRLRSVMDEARYRQYARNACLKAPDLDRMSRIAARYNRLIARIPKELDHAGEDKP